MLALWLALAAVGGVPSTHAGKLTRVWELDLRNAVRVRDGLPDFPVFALRFSPDGRRLAVIADIRGTREAKKSRLLVIDLDHPEANAPQFEVEFGILDSGVLNFGWSPSCGIIYHAGEVIHLATGAACELPNLSVFVTDSVAIHVLGQLNPVPLTPITFYSQGCDERARWEVPQSWLVWDVSTDRHLISVQREISAGTGDWLIVDPLERKVLRRWPENAGGAWKFADSGRVICQGGNPLNSRRAPAVCASADTGKEVGRTSRNGNEPIAAAARAARIVVSDYRRKRVPFDHEYGTTFKGRYVWDFGTGRELASWYPEFQTYPDTWAPAKRVTEQSRFAISPDGEFVAEGGNGVVRLYKIEP